MIYFVQHGEGGAIKIGTAINVRHRIDSLQSSCPEKLRLLAVIHGGIREEREAHEALKDHRIRGEWFSPNAVVLDYIASLDPKSFRPAIPNKQCRKRNTGSVYIRRDGRWVGAASLGIVNGRRLRKVVYGESKRKVLTKLRRLLDKKSADASE